MCYINIFFGLHSREIESTAQSAESKKHPKKETQTKKNRKKTEPNNAAKAPGRGDSERRKGTAEIETRRIYPNSNVINFYIATYKTGPRHKSDFNILSLSGFDNRKISFFSLPFEHENLFLGSRWFCVFFGTAEISVSPLDQWHCGGSTAKELSVQVKW